MSILLKSPGIKNIYFKDEDLMVVDLDNGRTFMVPLEKFPEIKKLSKTERDDFEIIDGCNLSFLAIDDIYNIMQLIGVS